MAPRPDQDVTAGARTHRVRPQLDVTTILEAALRLSGSGNPEPLTVRSLGNELGADPTAIYRHFRDKDELVHAVLDRLVHRAVNAVDPDAGWRERMTQLAQATLEVFGEHPSIGAVGASTTTGGEGELAAIELILVAMTDAGLGRQDSVRFYGVLSSYVISFAAAQAAAAVAGDVDADPVWIGVHRSLQHSRHPAITAVRDELEALRDHEVFESGVEVILDAVQARAAASSD